MNQEARCLLTRQGVKVWLTPEEAVGVVREINQDKKYIVVADRVINVADFTGIYKARDMYRMTQEKRGLWENKSHEWVTRNEDLGREPFIPEVEDVANSRGVNNDNLLEEKK